MKRSFRQRDIAIIGMAGMFPKSRNIDEYWSNLENGIDCISEIPYERWDNRKYYSSDKTEDNKTYSCWGGIIENAYEFDPMFFNIAPKEAPFLDPQQRKALEIAHDTISNAGYSAKDLENSDTGVFLGVMGRGYFDKILVNKNMLEGHMFTSSLLGFIPNRISFSLNLKGPSMAIDTLCSSSLVAIHEACKSLISGESSMALAGGVYIHFSPQHYILLSNMNVLSKDGRCKAFDEKANGIVSGEGVGMILLKPLDKAIEDRDNIHAIIKGSVINSDGRSSRFTTTNADAQIDLLSKAFLKAEVNPESISYIETHGTGTTIGDPVELMAIKKAYNKYTDKKGFCSIGSVKSNIGHLEPAAGVAGLIKTVLALENKKIPPTLHVDKINHFIDIINSPFVINDKLTKWVSNDVRRAGVSAFGMGGTNAHIILEEAPFRENVSQDSKLNIFCISAKTDDALKRLIDKYKIYLENNKSIFNEICYTANISRTDFKCRTAIVAESSSELRSKLSEVGEKFSEGLYMNSLVDSFYKNSHSDKARVFFYIDGEMQTQYIDSTIKNLSIMKDEIEKYEDIINEVCESEKFLAINQLYLKFIYFKSLMKLDVLPLGIVYSEKDSYLIAVLLNFISFDEAVKGIIGNKQLLIEDYLEKATKKFVVNLYNINQWRDIKNKNDILITVPNKALYNTTHCFYSVLAYLYVNGVNINWTNMYENEQIYKTELPSYPFERKVYRFDFENKELLSSKKSNQLLSLSENYKSFQCGIYSVIFNKSDVEFYSDHKVLGKNILPASAYLDIVYRAGKEFGDETIKQISDFILYQPLEVKEGIQLHIKLDKKDRIVTFSIYSCCKDKDGYKWTEHAQGNLNYIENKNCKNNNLDMYDLYNSENLNIDDFYEYFKYTGINYGSNFKQIKNIKRNINYVVSKFELDNNITNNSGLHPSAVDAVFQTVIGLIYDKAKNIGEPFLPFYIKNICIFDNKLDKGICKVALDKDNKGDNSLKANISVITNDGNELISITGFNMKQKLSGSKKIYNKDLLQKLKKPVWRKLNRSIEKKKEFKGKYIIFDVDNIFCQGLKNLFIKEKVDFISVTKGDAFRKKSDKEYILRAGKEEDIKLLIEAISMNISQFDGLLFLWPLENQDKVNCHNVDRTIENGLISLFIILKLIENSKSRKLKRFSVVTQNAWKIREDDIVHPQNTSIWGFMKVVKQELQGINSLTIDINENIKDLSSMMSNVFNQIIYDNSINEMAYRDDDRFEFVLEYNKQLDTNTGSILKSGGTYLITGGSGEIGLSLAENIDKDLNINLILIGKTLFESLAHDKKDRICKLINDGVNIQYISADVTNYESMCKAKDIIKSRYKKINGVFHAAGRIRDSLLKGKSIEDFLSVILPKIKGTLVLDEVLKDEETDFIMLFSSISSVIGIIGQSDYAAANAFMDGIAESTDFDKNYLSVNWSYWNIGMGQGCENTALRKGYKLLDSKEASLIALMLTGSKDKHVIVESKLEEIPLASNMTVENVKESEGIEEWLIFKLSEILGLNSEYLDVYTNLTDFGLDSILATKFIKFINDKFKTDLDVTEIFDYQNIFKLTNCIKSNIGKNLRCNDNIKEKNAENENKILNIQNCDINCILRNKLSSILEIEGDLIEDNVSFIDFGMDSILATKYVEEISSEMKIDIDPTTVFDYPNINQLANFIKNEFKQQVSQYLYKSSQEISDKVNCDKDIFGKNKFEEVTTNTNLKEEKICDDLISEKNNVYKEEDIAVIGMACRFPEANGLDEFWKNISMGISISGDFPSERIDDSVEIYKSDEYKQHKGKFYGSYLDEIDKFDPLFFEISPKEAELMDPQQRVLLEVVWQALEYAAYSKESLSGTKTGVFVGACIAEYMKYMKKYDSAAGIGNELSILSNRISYIYNLKGPSFTIDTACSSSLVAIDAACQNILMGRCNMAIAAGVNLILTPTFSIIFEKAGMLSKDGRCKTFDEAANGYLRGEGAGAIILKRLKDAVKDKDNILAVIKGTSINQDGHSNGLTAPNALAQEEVILKTWENGNIDPRTISMVEAHGTGTSIGDPIEIKALTKAFKRFTQDNSFCAIGSVKTNIGHLEGAAGISGVIKVILALMNKKLPPICNFTKKNKLINFVETPFYINDRLTEWKSQDISLRRATVSSFGFGGTNAHIVLEEAHKKEVKNYSCFYNNVILISAKNINDLIKKLFSLKNYLTNNFKDSLADLSYTLNVGRDHYNYRVSFIVKDTDSLVVELEDAINNLKNNTYDFKAINNRIAVKRKILVIFGEKWDDQNKFEFNKILKMYSQLQVDTFKIENTIKEYTNLIDNNMEQFNNKDDVDNEKIYIFLLNYLIGKILVKLGVSNINYIGIGAGAIIAKALNEEDHLEECVRDFIKLYSKNYNLDSKKKIKNKYKDYFLHSFEEIYEDNINSKQLNIVLDKNDFLYKNKENVVVVNEYNKSLEYTICNLIKSLYIKGVNLNLKEYYRNSNVCKIPLPGYPLSRKSYWIGNRMDKDERVTFMKRYFIEESLKEMENKNNELYIIISNSYNKLAINIKSKLEYSNKRCILIAINSNVNNELYSKINSTLNKINLNEFEYIKIVNLNIARGDQYTREIKFNSLIGLFNIVKCMYNKNTPNIYIVNIENVFSKLNKNLEMGLASVSSEFCRIIPYEFKNYSTKSIILENQYDEDNLINEIINFEGTELVYLNKGRRFVENYKSTEINIRKDNFEKKENSVVIVTGGLSGLGFEICKHLALEKGINLIITGRTKILSNNDADYKNSAKLLNLQTLKEGRVKVDYIQGDVCNYNLMKSVFEFANTKYDAISAVIHCAGIIDSKHISIRTKTENSITEILLPKVQGTLNISALSQYYNVDKLILNSSLAALSGFTGAGFSDYAAANAFMDTYSRLSNEYEGINIVSVNWPVWYGVGMSNRGLTTSEGYGIKVEDALKAFDKIFCSEYYGNIIVAGIDSNNLIKKLNSRNLPKKIKENKQYTKTSITRDNVSNYKNCKSKLLLKKLLKDLLKLSENEIDYDIDFNEYGIDSISLADMLGGIEEYYGVHLEPSIIIEYPNINLLGEYLENNCKANKKTYINEEAISNKIGDLTVSEVLKMLYEGYITEEEAWDYMIDHKIVEN